MALVSVFLVQGFPNPQLSLSQWKSLGIGPFRATNFIGPGKRLILPRVRTINGKTRFVAVAITSPRPATAAALPVEPVTDAPATAPAETTIDPGTATEVPIEAATGAGVTEAAAGAGAAEAGKCWVLL
jgi:hypothetical protein